MSPPDHETADGELVEEDLQEEGDESTDDDGYSDEASEEDERSRMLGNKPRGSQQRRDRGQSQVQHNRLTARDTTPPPRLVSVKDSSGRQMPASERAPLPKR